MFQQVLLRPDEYDVVATPNLNGDYLSDACAAQVGGLGMAPGANHRAMTSACSKPHTARRRSTPTRTCQPGLGHPVGVMMLATWAGWKRPT